MLSFFPNTREMSDVDQAAESREDKQKLFSLL